MVEADQTQNHIFSQSDKSSLGSSGDIVFLSLIAFGLLLLCLGLLYCVARVCCYRFWLNCCTTIKIKITSASTVHDLNHAMENGSTNHNARRSGWSKLRSKLQDGSLLTVRNYDNYYGREYSARPSCGNNINDNNNDEERIKSSRSFRPLSVTDLNNVESYYIYKETTNNKTLNGHAKNVLHEWT